MKHSLSANDDIADTGIIEFFQENFHLIPRSARKQIFQESFFGCRDSPRFFDAVLFLLIWMKIKKKSKKNRFRLDYFAKKDIVTLV